LELCIDDACQRAAAPKRYCDGQGGLVDAEQAVPVPVRQSQVVERVAVLLLRRPHVPLARGAFVLGNTTPVLKHEPGDELGPSVASCCG
jgi:hypothetical protein